MSEKHLILFEHIYPIFEEKEFDLKKIRLHQKKVV